MRARGNGGGRAARRTARRGYPSGLRAGGGPEGDPLDAQGLPAARIDLDDDSLQLRVELCRLEPLGHAGEELADDDLGLDADDRFGGAGHPQVGDVGGAPGEDALVGGLDVGVGADDRAHPTVEKPAEGDLFAGRLGVDVDDPHAGLAGDGLDLGQGGPERAVEIVHEHPAGDVEHGDLRAAARGDHDRTVAGGARRVVEGPQQAALLGDVAEDVFLVPDVVSGGDDVDAEAQQVLRGVGGDAETAGGVLAVGDGQVDVVRLLHLAQKERERLAPRLADDVADEQDLHYFA